MTLLKRTTLIIDDAVIRDVFYPVFLPSKTPMRCGTGWNGTPPSMAVRVDAVTGQRWLRANVSDRSGRGVSWRCSIPGPARIILALTSGVIDWSTGWWRVKLASVLLLSAYHGELSRWRRGFLKDRNTRSQRFFHIASEVPSLLVVIIVIMVTVKPF